MHTAVLVAVRPVESGTMGQLIYYSRYTRPHVTDLDTTKYTGMEIHFGALELGRAPAWLEGDCDDRDQFELGEIGYIMDLLLKRMAHRLVTA